VPFDHTWSHGSCILVCSDFGWSDHHNWSNGSPDGDPDPSGAVVVFPEDAPSDWDLNYNDIPGELPVRSLYYHRGGFETHATNIHNTVLLSHDIFTDLGSINFINMGIRFTSDANQFEHQIQVNDGGVLVFARGLTASPGALLNKSGNGTLSLSGYNQEYQDFHGAIAVHQGTLRVAGSYSLTNAQIVALDAGTTFDLNNFDTAASFPNFTPSLLGNIRLGSGVLSFSDGSNPDVEAAISGTGGLTVDGADARVTLGARGSYTYTGATWLRSGILWVDGALPGSSIMVFPQGTLSGGGMVSSVTAYGTLHPGSGGAHGSDLHSQGDVVFVPGSTFQIDIRGDGIDQYDHLDVAGTVDLGQGGMLGTNLFATVGSRSAEGATFTILHSDAGISGTFAGLPDNTVFLIDRKPFRIHYTGHDVVLTHLPQFLPRTFYSIGQTGSLNNIVHGDFNGDGTQDLVVNSGSDSLSLLLGNGDGTFRSAPPISLSFNPLALAAGHFHDPNILDLAVAGADSHVYVLLGNGDGTFQAPVSYTAGVGPTAIVAADLNGDGSDDLVVLNQYSRDVSILYANGDGTFQSAVTFGTFLFNGPTAVAVADLNGDQRPDVVVVESNGFVSQVHVFLADHLDDAGHVVYRHDAMDDYPVNCASIYNVAIGNFSGQIDVLLVCYNRGAVAVLRGHGDGTFIGNPTFIPVGYQPGGLGSGGVVIGDFDGDGALDVAVTATNASNLRGVSVLYGDGIGGFGPPNFYDVRDNPFAGAVAVTAADFNGDGSLDLAVPTTYGRVAVLLNSVPGQVPPSPRPGRQPGRRLPSLGDRSLASLLDNTESQRATAVSAGQANPLLFDRLMPRRVVDEAAIGQAIDRDLFAAIHADWPAWVDLAWPIDDSVLMRNRTEPLGSDVSLFR
jgi:autotransporter-associated beta strand protein